MNMVVQDTFFGNVFKILLFLHVVLFQDVAASTISFDDMTPLSTSSFSGTVKVTNAGVTGYICGTSRTPPAADGQVICNQYGYSSGEITFKSVTGNPSIVMKDPECVGTESDIVNCTGGTISSYSASQDCPYGVYAVACVNPYFTVNATVKLEGLLKDSGPILVYDETAKEYYYLCKDGSGADDEAEVVCRELGYKKSRFGVYSVTSSFWIKSPSCEGGEFALKKCMGFDSSKTQSCNFNVAGAVCSGNYSDFTYDMRSHMIWAGGRWASLCTEYMTAEQVEYAGDTICRQLGYIKAIEVEMVVPNEAFVANLHSLNCKASDKSLRSCDKMSLPNNKGFNCSKQLRLECQSVEERNDWYINIIVNVARFGLPPLIMSIFIPMAIILHARKKRQWRQQREQAAAAARAMPPPLGGMPTSTNQIDTTSGYPLGYSAPMANIAPPAYSSMFPKVGGAPPGNSVAPDPLQPGYVPPSPMYTLPPVNRP